MPDDLKPETPQETLSRVLDTVTKTKAWAAAKAESVERRIAELEQLPHAGSEHRLRCSQRHACLHVECEAID